MSIHANNVLSILYFYAISLLIRQIAAMGRKAKASGSRDDYIETTENPRPHSADASVTPLEHSDGSAMGLEALPGFEETSSPPPYYVQRRRRKDVVGKELWKVVIC